MVQKCSSIRLPNIEFCSNLGAQFQGKLTKWQQQQSAVCVCVCVSPELGGKERRKERRGRRRRYFNLISVARQFMARGLESNLHKLIYFLDLNN